MIKAIFFDKDGTLVRNDMYPLAPTDDILPKVIEGLLEIKDLGYEFFIVSNQSFINKGEMSKDEAESVFKTLFFKFKQNGIYFKEYVYCPHTSSEKCDCRKPKTLLVDELIQRFDIDIKNSFVVGDAEGDFKLALNLGCSFVAINNEFTTDKPDFNDKRINFIIDDFSELKNIIK